MRVCWLLLFGLAAACGFDRSGVAGSDDPGADADPGEPDAEVTVTPPDAPPAPPIDAAVCGADPTPLPDAVCPPACTGGCDGGVCTIDCTGGDACRQDTLVCPPDYTCAITCSGDRACERAIIECPALYGCAIACESSTACTDAEVRCGGGACDATCSAGPGPGGDFWGGGGDSVARPQVQCGSSCSCNPCGD